MLAETEENFLVGVSTGVLSGGPRSFVAANYLPVLKRPSESQIIGWLGAVDPEDWQAITAFAPTARQRHQVLRAGLEALSIRYEGDLNPEALRLKFGELLDEEGAIGRLKSIFASGARFQLSVEEAESLDADLEANSDLSLVYLSGHSHCGWRFREGAWTNASMERFHCQYWKLLRQMLQRPDVPIGGLDYLPDEEFDLVTNRISGVPDYECEHSSTASRFEKIAKDFAERTAVVCGGKQISYRDLNEAANRLAHYLMYFSVRPSSVVAICLPPSIELVIAKLAIHKLGAVSLVLDQRSSVEEHAKLLLSCGNPLCIADTSFEGGNALYLAKEASAIRSQSKLNPSVQIRPEHAAEIVVAFDASGAPQTVLNLHRSVLLASAGNSFLRFGCDDVVVQASRSDSAAGSFEFWSALLNGGKLVLPIVEFGDDIAGLAVFIKKNKASRLLIPEGRLAAWLKDGLEGLLAPETLIVWGPDEQSRVIAQLAAHRRKGRILHAYGNAGMGLIGLLRPIATAETGSTLAEPVPGTAVYVLDSAGAPVAIGAVGELCVEGPGLAWGYMNDAGQERPSYAAKDFGRGESGRYYRTGDLVRWNDRGRLERVARLGQLAQLDELKLDLFAIEREILKAPQVLACAVVVRQVAGHLKRLVAYVQLQEPVVNLRRVLRDELAKSLPCHMLPHEFVTVQSLPLKADGQLDRQALSAPALGPEVSDAEADARAAEAGKLRRVHPSVSRPGLWDLWKQALRKIV
jgi:non-ribosomal peptide synthetase component F